MICAMLIARRLQLHPHHQWVVASKQANGHKNHQVVAMRGRLPASRGFCCCL
ncbi:hypothetical protein BDA96_08G153800 [Sorghum bicolor]|uniref:Uncharacterized protein n=2 Tax=Sorghum bicolor TaxID=4558 RepID=A0A921QIY3_SORBI|nr:hypothetical protein BDA96_08G153800 [Sorghum bicolor]OQU79406.1 hypothetical protein SORBI_3008G139250 [Sorghum bicolor]